MNKKTLILTTTLATALLVGNCFGDDLPEGYWSLDQATEVLNKTRTVVLDPDISSLSQAEKSVAAKLMQVGEIFNRIYQHSLHPQALESLQNLLVFHDGGEHTSALLDIYYRSGGPITTTLDNKRVAFLPVVPEEPGKNVYPSGLTTEQLDPLLKARPELAAGLMNVRTVVRTSTEENLRLDLRSLDYFPVLDDMHPGLRSRLKAISAGKDDARWYALPYSVRWAPDIMRAYKLLLAAAEDIRAEDPDFAAYLSLRARDIISDDYEGGDAAWVRGRFKNLNAQIGSYEVYADSLYGVKSFFSLNVLIRDLEKSAELSAAMGGLQAIQDSLPIATERKIQSDISVGVYNILADFGQSRGANTATILPNDADHTRKYGRTILLRYNIMANPGLFEDRKETFQTAVNTAHANDLTLDGPFYRTLWHEVGHYLGVDKTTDGRELNEALSPWGSHYEEMKADLVSAFTSAHLNANGKMDDEIFRSVQAASVLRVLQKNQPLTAQQPYQTMQLMQMNYFLEHGLLSFDESSARLEIHYDRYNEVIAQMLKDVLNIQQQGNAQQAGEFIEKYINWTPGLHDRLAKRLRDASRYRFVAVRYKALPEDF